MGPTIDVPVRGRSAADAVNPLTALDAWIVRRCCDFRGNPWVASFFLLASRLGDGPVWYAVAVAGIGLGDVRVRWATAAAGAAVALSSLVFCLVKGRVARARPFEVWADVPCLLVPPDRYSFPSGHTMNAFAVLAAFRAVIPGSEAFFLPLAAWIGASRVFLGVHYPTDVLAGAALGTALGTAVGRAAAGLL